MSATSGFFVIVCKHWGITNTSDEFRTHLDQLTVSLNISVILCTVCFGKWTESHRTQSHKLLRQKVTGLKVTKLLRQKVTVQKVTIYMFYPGRQKVTTYIFA